MSIAVRILSRIHDWQYQLFFLGSKARRTVRGCLYFPNKLGLTVFHAVN